MFKKILVIFTLVLTATTLWYQLNRNKKIANENYIQELPGSGHVVLRTKEKSGYFEKKINLGEEFVLEPDNFIDESFDRPVGKNIIAKMKFRLSGIGDNAAEFEFLGQEGFDGKLYMYDEIRKEIVKDNSCIYAAPLVMDVAFEYCFKVYPLDSRLFLDLTVKSRSTLPKM